MVALPFILSLGIVILLTSGRPIFFRQKRAGLRGKSFEMLKFRSMYPGAHRHQKRYQNLNQAPAPMFKIKDDPRFTKLGKWLSKTGLDELPQLWHIVKGEVSFIGPRPLPLNESRSLSKNWQFRSFVRPGILSEWALHPKRYTSLKSWRNLELATLAQGGWSYDLKLILTKVRQLWLKW